MHCRASVGLAGVGAATLAKHHVPTIFACRRVAVIAIRNFHANFARRNQASITLDYTGTALAELDVASQALVHSVAI